MSLTKEQVKFIEKTRAEGCTWKETSDEFNELFGTTHNKDSMRLKYNYYAGDEPNYDNIDELKKQRRAQVSANEARKKLRKSLDAQITLEDVMGELKQVAKDIKKLPKVKMVRPSKNKTKMTVEALIGDVQIGKIMEDYNSDICAKRIQEHAECIILKVQQYQSQGYDVERIVLSMLGDMIENSEKHPNSGKATDQGTAEQMRAITVHLYHKMLVPLAQLGIPIDVKCVTGNHDWGGHKLEMFYPGREHLSWVFYNMLDELCQAAGIKHINFEVAEGSFLIYDIYGHQVLIEHGVGVGATEASMSARLNSRIRQCKKHISFFRMGDKHHVARFNNDQYVINGAYFGSDEKGVEYSGILGYYSPATQVMFSYVPRKKNDPRTPIFDSFVIQLGHVK